MNSSLTARPRGHRRRLRRPPGRPASRSGESSSRIGFVLLMWTSTLRGRSQPGERLERPAGARERHVAHVARAAVRDAQPRELVVAPERAVDEHEVARGEPGEHVVVEPGEPGDVGDDAAARAVAERRSPLASSSMSDPQIARRVAARRERLDRRGSTRRAAAAAPARASATRRRSSAPASRSTGYPSRQRALDARARRRRAPASPDSRSSSSPAVWSISASVSSTPAIGGARTPSARGASSVSSC